MAYYYFSLETSGLDADSGEVVLAALQELDPKSGVALSDLELFSSWDVGEKNVLMSLVKRFNSAPFDFVPVGVNLDFHLTFLFERCQKLMNLNFDNVIKSPRIDLKPTLVLLNEGRFRGYDHVLEPKLDVDVVGLVKEEKHLAIEVYAKKKAARFLSQYRFMLMNLPQLKGRYAGYKLEFEKGAVPERE